MRNTPLFLFFSGIIIIVWTIFFRIWIICVIWCVRSGIIGAINTLTLVRTALSHHITFTILLFALWSLAIASLFKFIRLNNLERIALNHLKGKGILCQNCISRFLSFLIIILRITAIYTHTETTTHLSSCKTLAIQLQTLGFPTLARHTRSLDIIIFQLESWDFINYFHLLE